MPLSALLHAILLDRHCVVDIAATCLFYRFDTHLITLCTELDAIFRRDTRSLMTRCSDLAPRLPTCQHGASFVSASMAVHVYTSPMPNMPFRSSSTFFCFTPTNDQISSHCTFLQVKPCITRSWYGAHVAPTSANSLRTVFLLAH